MEGGFWSQRKAVDVTAPTGFMKVESTTGRNMAYYEIRFEPGGNIPVMYEPFRPEKQARLIIGTEDASPVSICFDLRSEDSKKDQDKDSKKGQDKDSKTDQDKDSKTDQVKDSEEDTGSNYYHFDTDSY